MAESVASDYFAAVSVVVDDDFVVVVAAYVGLEYLGVAVLAVARLHQRLL